MIILCGFVCMLPFATSFSQNKGAITGIINKGNIMTQQEVERLL